MAVHRRTALIAFVVVVLSIGCGAGSPVAPAASNTSAPVTSSTCTVTVAGDQLTRNVSYQAETFSINVSTSSSCSWVATTTDDFVTIVTGASGTGSGVVEIRISANTGAERSGQIKIGSALVRVQQAGPPETKENPTPAPPNPNPVPSPVPTDGCVFSVTPLSFHVPASGGTVTISVRATQGNNCSWTAMPVSLFVSLNGEPGRAGDGTVTFTVSPNTGPIRTGTATVAGQTIAITQDPVAATACVFDLSPTRVTLPVGGGTATFSVRVTQGTACAWATTLAGAGMTITSGASGIGDGTVIVAVSGNPGVARTNGIIIAGQLVTIFQPELPGACSYTATPQNFNISSASQTIAFDLTITKGTPDNCQWSASVLDPSVIRVLSMTPSGNTTHLEIWVSANTGRLDRALSVVAADIIVVVTQAGSIPPGACAYAVSQATFTVPATASNVSLSVSLVQGSVFACSWSAASNASFITFTLGPPNPDTGGAVAVISVAPNPGAARAGTLTIAGNLVTVNQQSATTLR